MMPREFQAFLDDCRTAGIDQKQVDALENALAAVDLEGDSNTHAIGLLDALSWICRQRSRTTMEKLVAVAKLVNLAGPVRIPNLRKFLGW